MPVSHKHKIILVHIPKTGGTSIESALGMHAGKNKIGLTPAKRQLRDYQNLFGAGIQHMTLNEIKNYYNTINFMNYDSFGNIKHVLDNIINALAQKQTSEIGSEIFRKYYKFAVVRNPYDRLVSHFSWVDGKWHKKIEPTKDEFIEFVDSIIDKKLYKTDLHLVPQHAYVEVDNLVAVDRILHVENLSEEFSSLCDELEINAELKKRMASNHKDYTYYYNDEIRQKVYDIYKRDFELFGYSDAF